MESQIQFDGSCTVTGSTGNGVCADDDCDILEFMAKEVGLTVLHPGGMRATDELLSRCSNFQCDKVLDVACGKGTSSLYFAKKLQSDVWGIDIDDDLLSSAKTLAKTHRIETALTFEKADATQLSFDDAMFDLTLFQAALVLIDNDEEALKEAVRVTKQGGHVALLELTWLKPPTEQLLNETKQKICARCIAQAKSAESWKHMMSTAGLKLVSTHLSEMSRSGFKDETIGTYLGILWKMATQARIRKRLQAINNYFKKADGYLGYGIYIGEKL